METTTTPLDAGSRRLETPLGIGAALLAFGVYLGTLCPTLNFIDSGELASVASTLGIAHPTGYPLFTLAGWLFSHLPLGLRVIQKMNVMAAVATAGALVLYFRCFLYLLSLQDVRRAKDKRSLPPRLLDVTLPSLAGTLLLAFSSTYWSQALAVEVYSLHLLLLGAVLLLYCKALFPQFAGGEEARTAATMPLLLGFAFVLGLAFSNHMTTVFLAPAFLYLYFAAFGAGASSWKRLLLLGLPFAAGLSVYLYLPYRAAEQPFFNWGNPVSWEAFLRHTSAKQYSVWLFSSGETAKQQLGYFLSGLPEEFAYGGLLLAIVGLWGLFRSHRRLFLFTLLLFLGCVLYAINYDIHDIDSYFLLAYVVIALWAGFGVRELLRTAVGAWGRRAVAAFALLCVAAEGGMHARAVTLHDMTLVEEYANDMFRSVGENALVVTYQWDYFVSASYYLQQVEGVRPDIVVIDKELLRRSWYYTQLERQHPGLVAGSRAEINALLVELRKFEHELPYNPQVIEARFAAVIRSFLEKGAATRPVYVTPEIEPQYTVGMRRVPSGLAERIVAAADTGAVAEPRFSFHPPARHDSYVDGLLGLYAQAYLRYAAFEASAGRYASALAYVERALTVVPGHPTALLLEAQLKERVKQGG